MAIVLRCAAWLLLVAVLLGSAAAYHEVGCCDSCGVPFTPVAKFRVLCPDDVTQECYYNAAIDNWYYWTNVDYNEPGPHVGSFALYKTGIMGMGYEQSLGGDCGNPLCSSDTTGANMFIYIEPASRNCAQLGTAAMAGQYCDVVSGFAPTCRVGTITRHFQSYHSCSTGYLDCVSRITVQDTTAPYLGLPPDITLECGSDTSPTVTGTPYVYDRCDTAVPTLTRVDTVTTPTPCTTSISRAWTASDNCGNRQTQTQTITVADTLPPVFTSWPADTTVPCASSIPMGFTPATPTAADVCAASPAVTVGAPIDVNRVCPNKFVRQWVFTATDAVGCNTAKHTVSIIVSDTLAPTIVGLTDGAYTEQDCRPAALTPTATDNCDTITPIYTEEVVPIPGRVGYYDLHRLAVATDSCGNTARASDLVRYSLRAAVSISPPAVASVAFANPITFQVTVTWTPAGACGIPDGSFFMYFEPFPFTAAVTGLTCETVTVGGSTVTPGEVRCAIPTSAASPQSYSVTLTPPTWLVTSQQWKINFGVASTTWANIAPLSTAVITIN